MTNPQVEGSSHSVVATYAPKRRRSKPLVLQGEYATYFGHRVMYYFLNPKPSLFGAKPQACAGHGCGKCLGSFSQQSVI